MKKQDLEIGCTPVYLTDLNDREREATLNDWNAHGRKDLVEAYEKGRIIIIGYYLQDYNGVVEE
jgi:hypothetical protein